MQLSVIIVNYNVKYFLEQCLFSVQKASTDLAVEVWVVDNASQDGSRNYLETKFPWVQFIWNHTNIGFAKGNNQALQKATGEFVLFLNPDTIVPEDCFTKCINFLKQQADAGALGIRMIDGKGMFLPESKRSFPSPSASFYKLSGLSFLFPKSKTFGRYHLGHLSEHQNHEVDVLSGAFMMIRKEVLQKTGGFDESFFMYGEDIDLSFRIQQMMCAETKTNYKNYYFSDSSIIHFKGESTRKGSLNYVRMFYKAMNLFANKHATAFNAGIFSAFISVAIWVRALLSLFKRALQKTGLALLDVIIILLLFWVVKYFWTVFIKPQNVYQNQLLLISFAGFAGLFLLVSYYTGLYEKKFRYKKLWHSLTISLILILAAYSLLPEHFRFSRGIVLAGSVLSFSVLAAWRWMLVKGSLLESDDYTDSNTIIAGTQNEVAQINSLIGTSEKNKNIAGFLSPIQEEHSLGIPSNYTQVLANIPATELVFCESDQLSFSEIISLYQKANNKVTLRLHAGGSNSIVGSDSKNETGNTVGAKQYILDHTVNKRLKRLGDIFCSLLFIITAPLHFVFNKHPLILLHHSFEVLSNKKTWMGYTGDVQQLPILKPSILGPAGVPHSKNILNSDGLQLTNDWYAHTYEPLYDLVTIFTNYKNLGVK